MRKSVAGIDVVPGTVGFQQIQIQPVLDASLAWAEGTYDSMAGPIRARWERHRDTVRLSVTIPANTEAEIVMPIGTKGEVREGDMAVTAGISNGYARIATGSGSYEFTVE